MVQPVIGTPSALIQSAFEQARNSGKPEWHRMTIAVLKNRLLTLTDGQFQETAFGAPTMRDFVKRASEIVRIDETGNLPVVVLLGEEPAELPSELPPRIRVRDDLWRAIVDYSRNSTFVWDPEGNYARAGSPTDNLPILPTITENELREWRQSFADRHSAGLDEPIISHLQAWREHILPSRVLPRPLSEAWLTELSSKVLSRLRSWFAENNLKEPSDLIFNLAKQKPQGRGDLDALRNLIIGCVEVMDEDELSELRFPPGIYLRAAQEKKKRG